MVEKNIKMEKLKLKLTIEAGVTQPKYMTEGSAGMDVSAYIKESVIIEPMKRALIPTGIKMEIPLGYEIQVRPRSGLAAKYGITLVNTPGTIDSDYRGELKIILINFGEESYTINNGDRIAQLVLQKVYRAEIEVCNELEETLRSEGGFGHTGKN